MLVSKSRSSAITLAPPTQEKIHTNRFVKKIKQTVTNTEPGKVVPPEIVALDWHSVESADFKEYIKNLRAIGCPEETIRDIIIADVNKLFAPRIKAYFTPAKELNYWEESNNNEVWNNRKFQKESAAVEREKRALIKELLGIDVNKEMEKINGWGQTEQEERLLSFLPQEKSDAVKALREKYQDETRKIYEMKDSDSPENREQLKKLKEQQKAELAQLLSPDELEKYEVRLSETADTLRYSLNGFNPSEQEFLALFKIRKNHDEQFQNMSEDLDDEMANKRRGEISKKMEDDLKVALPPERYADYKRANDWEYRELRRFTEEQELPKEAAVKIYDIKKTVEDEIKKVRADKTLNAEQRKAALKAMKEETEKTLTDVMGDQKTLKRHKSYNGHWLRNLGK
ncbi:MAG: hypothetical protein M3Y82_02480 [Verrucomicrobiota bacterium]|nr:hypothetical protein [Verrucomicrobiota bacterium]